MKSPIFAGILAGLVVCWLAVFSVNPSGGEEGRDRDEVYRPQFHFTATKGWMNDPNGLVFYAGEYHLFFQHNAKGNNWVSELSWGHAVSKDLLHWKSLADVLEPMPLPNHQVAGSWSGSGFVDWNNSAGFQTGPEKPIVLAWTAAGLGQCLAFSNDRGRSFTPYTGNPVVPMDQHLKGDWDRDPMIFWHEPTHQWVMVLSITGKGVAISTAPDLKRWTRRSTFPGLFECPNLYELPVEGKAIKKWVLQDASGKYFIGQFDGTTFTQESGPFAIDQGKNYYAAQTWSDVPASDGRRLSIAWMQGGKFPGMAFNQQMTIPTVLTLRSLREGLRLTKLPVKEVGSLHHDGKTWENLALPQGTNLLAAITGDTFDIEADLDIGAAKEIDLKVRGESIRFAAGTLSCLGKSIKLEPLAGRIKLRVLVDRTSLEIFANDGAASITIAMLPSTENKSLELKSHGGEARVVFLHVFRMRSVWEK